MQFLNVVSSSVCRTRVDYIFNPHTYWKTYNIFRHTTAFGTIVVKTWSSLYRKRLLDGSGNADRVILKSVSQTVYRWRLNRSRNDTPGASTDSPNETSFDRVEGTRCRKNENGFSPSRPPGELSCRKKKRTAARGVKKYFNKTCPGRGGRRWDVTSDCDRDDSGAIPIRDFGPWPRGFIPNV